MSLPVVVLLAFGFVYRHDLGTKALLIYVLLWLAGAYAVLHVLEAPRILLTSWEALLAIAMYFHVKLAELPLR
jgi:hypothetical protein